MAESQDAKCQEDISQKSSTADHGNHKMKELFLRMKIKRREKDPETECPADTSRTMTVKAPSTEDTVTSTSKSKLKKFIKVPSKIFKTKEQTENNVVPSSETPLTFKQNLKDQHFAVAGRQLIHREERLFSVKQDGVGSSKSLVEEKEDDKESLRKDYEELYEAVWSTVENTFKVQTEEEKKALKQAVQLIQEQEQQDRRWEGVAEKERPPWRPQCCKRTHDSRLQNMVMRRMEEAKLDAGTAIKSSIEKEIESKGKQLQDDLIHIETHVTSCYPEENLCQLYAELYHQAFRATLREIADYGLTDDDSLQVLQWVNIHYPSILRLVRVIEYEQLEALLPENMLGPLEDQYLAQKENELQTWCQNILKLTKPDPELRDGYYVSQLATNVTEFVHSAIKTAQNLLGSCSKLQRITIQIKEFLINYQDYLMNITEDNQRDTDAVLKANLRCIRQFKEYITEKQELFHPRIRSDCMNLLVSMREHCHGYFTKPVHKDLKSTYAKLGSQDWLKHGEDVCGELLTKVETHIQQFKNLDKECLKVHGVYVY
ncbi:hypothetical protein NFI96_025543 [Prochilodus magdalenae]|nr:hypothetical protein NFI96_025543 [Prochilodus magdalenae]